MSAGARVLGGIFTFAAASLGLECCPAGYQPSTLPQDSVYVVPPEAALPASTGDGDACSAQCAVLRSEGCQTGTGFPGGESCEDVCRRRAALGIAMPTGC